MMRRAGLAFAVSCILAAAPVGAQQGRDGGPPPPQFPPKVDPKGKPPPPGPRPRRGDQMSSLINYMARAGTDFSGEIDSPVTGYANEALWESVEARQAAAKARRLR